MEEQPKIVVNVFAKNKDGKIIVIKRKKQGEWSVPGGHLEKYETLFECAERECLEETNVNIECIKILGFSQELFKDKEISYIFFWIEANVISGELNNQEPERASEVKWTSMENFPTPVFGPVKKFLDKKYFEVK